MPFAAVAGGPTAHTLPQAMTKEKLEQQNLLNEYELKRKAKTVVVPTEDARVRAVLRQMGEPMTLFGEREVRCTHLLIHRSSCSAATIMGRPW